MHPYEAAGTILHVRISTDKPLCPRPPPPPPPVPRPSDLVPKRLLPSLRPKTATKDLEDSIRHVVASLVDEFAKQFGSEAQDDQRPEARDERRRAFLFALNNDGTYFNYKERLKRNVVRVVREHFAKQHAEDLPEDAAERDRFHSELYLHLMKHMHGVLRDQFRKPGGAADNATDATDGGNQALDAALGDGSHRRATAPVVPSAMPRLEQLVMLANEAEADMHMDAALDLWKERVALDPYDAALWCDLAMAFIRAGQASKAEAAFREAVALRPEHTRALLGLGCLLAARDDMDAAEVGRSRSRGAPPPLACGGHCSLQPPDALPCGRRCSSRAQRTWNPTRPLAWPSWPASTPRPTAHSTRSED